MTREESDGLIKVINNHFEAHGYGLYAVERKDNGNFIGFTGLNIPNFEAHFTPCVEIGWRLSYENWGQGFATEAAIAVKDYAFAELNLDEIVSFTFEGNHRSRNVMQKIGLKHDEKDDFLHPRLDSKHPLLKHVLYRLKKTG